MRIGLDAMGGDYAPREIVRGALDGLQYLGPDDQVVLFGIQERVEPELREAGASDPRIVVHHCPEVIEMKESPVEAIKTKRRSSICVMAAEHAHHKVDAIISAGHTGAFAAASLLRLGTVGGVSRPGIAVIMPTFHGPVVICDVGANTQPKPHHLLEYAQMSVVYAQKILHIAKPRVGIVSIGEEEGKGTSLVKEAGALLKADPQLRFVGNLEGRDIFSGACEVAICDGYVGNVILKLIEGMAEGLFKTITQEIRHEAEELVARFDPIVNRIWRKHDFAEYGGAPLLGLNGLAIICHGRSDRRAIANAIRVSAEQIRNDFTNALAAELRRPEVPA